MKKWQTWVGLAISVLALALVLRGINLQEVTKALAQAEYGYFGLAAVALFGFLITRAVRWRLLLGPGISLSRCFWVTCIGYLVSNVLPFRLGDPARAVVVGRDGRFSTPGALSTVVVERVLDMLVVVLLLAGIAPFIPRAREYAGAGLLAGGLAVVALAVLFLLAVRPDWGRALAGWGIGLIPQVDGGPGGGWRRRWASWLDRARWTQVSDGLIDGLAPLRSGRRGLALLSWSAVIWGFSVVLYWAILRAFFTRPPVLAAPMVVCATGFGMAIPSSPGAMGVFHAMAREALQLPFGVPKEPAVAFAFAAHTFQYTLSCLLGLIGLGRESLSLGWVRSQAMTAKEEEEQR